MFLVDGKTYWPLYVDGEIARTTIIGLGSVAYVLPAGPDAVLKIPALREGLEESLSPADYEDYRREVVESIEEEKAVYRRLDQVAGVARCLEIVPRGIKLEYFPRGCLHEYIAFQAEAGLNIKKRWILEILNTVRGCHEAGVLNFDIQLRNLMIAEDSTLRMIDFGYIAMFPKGTNMESAVDPDGEDISLELFILGNVIYSISAWTPYINDKVGGCFGWPDRASLPSTTGLPYGTLVEACWRGQYRNIEMPIRDLLRARSRRKSKARLRARL